MTDKQIIIDGVNVKDCKRRIGKDNYCRYYKRLCSENNYNCIWKKYLRKEQECEELKQTLAEIKEIAEKDKTACESCSERYTDGCTGYKDFENEGDCTHCGIGARASLAKQILQKISECEVNNAR